MGWMNVGFPIVSWKLLCLSVFDIGLFPKGLLSRPKSRELEPT